MKTPHLERIPPQAIEAEQATLGACLLEQDAIAYTIETLRLRPDEFYRTAHQDIFAGVLALYAKRQPVDLITLGEWLREHDRLDTIGGTLYLTTMMSQVPTASGIAHYGGIVRQKAMQRRAIQIGDTLTRDSYDADDETFDTVVTGAEAALDALRAGNLTAAVDAPQLCYSERDEFYRLEEELKSQQAPVRITLGVSGMSGLVDELLPGDFVLIVGRPAMGKSLLAQACVIANAKAGKSVLFLSLEMSAAAIARRVLIAESQDVQNWEIKSFARRKAEWEPRIAPQFADVIERHYEWDVALLQRDTVTPAEVMSLGKRKRRNGGLDVIVIDYLQLMESGIRTEKRHEEVAFISRKLKQVAGHLRVPLVVVAQLNRNCEQRADKRPVLSDVAESDGLGKDADLCVAVYRPGYYNAAIPPTQGELIVLKQRNGPPGSRALFIDLDRSRMSGVAE